MKGDLIVGLGGDLVEGDLVGGFGIGNADVPIWGGVNGVGTLSLPEVPGVPWGPSPVYHCLLVVSRNPSGLSCHTVPFGVSPLLSGPLSQLSTAPPYMSTNMLFDKTRGSPMTWTIARTNSALSGSALGTWRQLQVNLLLQL